MPVMFQIVKVFGGVKTYYDGSLFGRLCDVKKMEIDEAKKDLARIRKDMLPGSVYIEVAK